MHYTIFATVIALAGFVNLFMVRPAVADCPILPAARVTLKITAPQDGMYRMWLRQLTPTNSQNGLFMQLDENCVTSIAPNGIRDVFGWVGSDAKDESLIFALSEGEHTIKIGGEQTANAIDSGFFTADLLCLPVENGDNCLIVPEPEVIVDTPAEKIEQAFLDKRLAMFIAAVWTVALVVTSALLIEKYKRFLRRSLHAKVSVPWYKQAFSPTNFLTFLEHHPVFVATCGGTLLALIVAFVFGVSVMAANDPRFEAESGTLSGGAKIVENELASAGAFVAFDAIPTPVAEGQQPQPQPVATSQQPNNNGGNSGGNNSGGNNNGGGGGGDNGGGGPVEVCPPYPSFPDENCTGWEHTGVTLSNCDHLVDTNGTGDGWIWEDNPIKTFDKCYFSGNLTIQAPGITITRSQVHGSISHHGSNGYSLRGLQLIDVELEQEGVAVPRGAIGGNDWSCVRCDAHHGVTGMHFGDNTHIRDSYVHDMQWLDGSHGSGIATGQDHGSNSTIIHNNIQCNRVNGPPICSSALSIYPEDDNGDGQTVKNVEVKENLFNATGAYCVYAVSIPGSNINFINNVFGKKFYPGCAGYGPVTGYGSAGGAWINNVWAEGSGHTGQVDPFVTY